VAFWPERFDGAEPGTVVLFHWFLALLVAVEVTVVSLVRSIAVTGLFWTFVARSPGWGSSRLPAFWIESSDVIWIFAVVLFNSRAVSWSLTSTFPITAVSDVLVVTAAEPFWALVASSDLWTDVISETFWVLNLDVVKISALMFNHSGWTINNWIDDLAIAFPVTTVGDIRFVTFEGFLWAFSTGPVSNWEADAFWEVFVNFSFPSGHGVSWLRALNTWSTVTNDFVPGLTVLSSAFTDTFVTFKSVRSDVEWNVNLSHNRVVFWVKAVVRSTVWVSSDLTVPFFTAAVNSAARDLPLDDSSGLTFFSSAAWWHITHIWASTASAVVFIAAFVIWMSTDNRPSETTFPVASSSIRNRALVAFVFDLAFLLLARVFDAASTAGAGDFIVGTGFWSSLLAEWIVLDVEVTLLAVFTSLVETFVLSTFDLVNPDVIKWFWNLTFEHALVALRASTFKDWAAVFFEFGRAIIIVNLARSTSPTIFWFLAHLSMAFFASVVYEPWAFSLVTSTFLVLAAEDAADNWAWSIDNSLVFILATVAVWIVSITDVET
jgi:hypothetical protein